MGLEGIQAAQARIAEIQQTVSSRLGTRPPAASSSTDTFASALDRAQLAGIDGGAPTDPSRVQWASDLLGRLGMPVTSENVRAMTAWAQAEGTDAAFNPLATTQSQTGATSFNSVGVKNYTSYDNGIDATVQTLTNGRYGAILTALRSGNSAEAVARAVADSPWGTGDGVLRVLRAAAQ